MPLPGVGEASPRQWRGEPRPLSQPAAVSPSQILGLLSPLLGAGPPFLAPCKPSAFLAGVPKRAWMPSSPQSVLQTDYQFQL